MKTLSLFCFLLAASISVQSQIVLKATLSTATGAVSGADSAVVTNTGSGTLYTPKVSKGKLVGIVVTFTETSGTSGGSAVLQGSVDGSKWVTVGSAYTVTDVAEQSTAFSNAATANFYSYYRVVHTGAGTMASRFKAKVSTF